MPTERISFTGHAGHDLAARLDLPEGPVLATALFAHCFTCSKDIPAARRIAARLSAMGIAVLRFDFTGLGHSGGEFANTSFTSNVADLIAAARYLASRNMAPDMLIGHSLGGAAVLRARAGIPSVKSVVTLGAPFDPGHVAHHFEDALEAINRDGQAEVNLGGRPFVIGKEFVDDIRQTELGEAVADLRAALLVMHAPRDATVGIDNAAEIFQAARHPKSFVTLDNADHLVTREANSAYAGKVLAAWAERYIAQADAAVEPAPHVHGAVVAQGALADGFLVSVNADGHPLLGDEPASYGGTDRGPTPYDYLSTALGTCTVMTLNFFARREKIPLELAEVEVRHDRIHARDCADCETETGHVDRFQRRIALTGDLDPAQRRLLLKIADRCPVHKTLESEIKIENELVPVEEVRSPQGGQMLPTIELTCRPTCL
ncbi:MAG: OsmC family protein [Tritonibacter mobilis]|nr:OsmC family protein [Tritonibacter mobilis]